MIRSEKRSPSLDPAASDPRRTGSALVAVFVAYFASTMVISTLTVALPRIAAELDGMHLFSWALALPGLAAALSTLLFGKLSDLYGRRALLLAAMGLYLLGAAISTASTTFEVLIAALFVIGLGQGAIAPLCFSVLGDLFPPVERSRWAGLLNIPAGVMALFGPTLSGWLVDNLSWRYIFGLVIPFTLLSGAAILLGLPSLGRRASHRIDLLGSALLVAATSTMIVGFSWAGSSYAWGSVQVLGLLFASCLFWGLFLRIEARASEPMLDPQVLLSRTFVTAAFSAFLSFFGLTAITAYYPLFVQGVQGAGATLSGQVMTPFSVLMAFMGVPAGLLLSRTRRYKWMYVGGYAILTIALVGLARFTNRTPIAWGFAVTTVAGLGLGTIPTINTLVAQYALPRRLLGAATGGIFFFVMLGRAISPALLGSAMNHAYIDSLTALLPAIPPGQLDDGILTSIGNPRVLLSAPAMAELEGAFRDLGDQGPALFQQVVAAIRASMQSALREVFLLGAVTMLATFLLVLTIPEIALDTEAPDRRPSLTAST